MAYTVYVHQNIENGKRYVGITANDPKVRWKNGFGYSDKLPIGRAFRKYGWDAFTHEIIAENLSESEAKEMEVQLIAEWRTQEHELGYNICSGGEGVSGWHPTEEAKRKMSDAAKGRCGEANGNYGHRWTDEMRAAASKRKRNIADETRAKMSEAMSRRVGELNNFYGKRHSEETKRKISEARSRPVLMFAKDMTLLNRFPSIKSASENTGIHKVAISNCCRGATKTSGGFIWRYE